MSPTHSNTQTSQIMLFKNKINRKIISFLILFLSNTILFSLDNDVKRTYFKILPHKLETLYVNNGKIICNKLK